MQCQINRSSENYFFNFFLWQVEVHEGQDVSCQSRRHGAFHYSDTRYGGGNVCSSRLLIDVMSDFCFELQ